MLNENAQSLVAALRSGEYTQTTERLRFAGCYCVAGVAADLWAKAHGVEWTVDGLGWDAIAGHATEMPEDAAQWFGFSDCRGSFGPRDECNGAHSDLICENDGGKTFAEIADIIESQPEGLFA